jgi:hypothetical protein
MRGRSPHNQAMARPNLFDYATSELSQDAFLCWLVANAAHDEDPKLRNVGRAFIAWLWQAAHRGAAKPEGIRLVDGPHRQVDKIDALFEAEIEGSPTTFVIEDKTDTSQHSGQLRRYKEAVGDGAGEVVFIYLKTGYHFGVDAAAAEHGYTVIGLKEWVGFLDDQAVTNDIFDDYRVSMRESLRVREENITALLALGGHKKLSDDYVQFEFMTRLAAQCRDALGGSAISPGKNIGGTPWTQLHFAHFVRCFPAASGSLSSIGSTRAMTRSVSVASTSPRGSTRPVKEKQEARTEKLRRLRAHRTAFLEAVTASGCGLRFSRPAGDNHGANESDVGILFFDDEANTVAAVLEKFPLVHRAFVQSIQASALE